ncbi:beta,beta-carotene 15,15'-dioxygenase-like [Aplysia californica]|uniref:Beta,beta-carotene 15,15'-dioxygenase-like n=1 Tax=Aplysia californica TaxID=6500 RepID=A0ABM1A9V4_APLCA|nr:beta,beta-carotene 15,15'-dioxygenase-like [Aplysia californica]
MVRRAPMLWRVPLVLTLCLQASRVVTDAACDVTHGCTDSGQSADQAAERGFSLFFQSNLKELEDVPVTFVKPLPPWMNGTLVRNGLGQYENGPRRVVHAFDGFAKLASWKFQGNSTALFSTKFIRSRVYRMSQKTNTIAPFLLFQSVTPPFSFFEKVRCLLRGIDNMNINIFRFPHPKKKRHEYAALSDFWISYKIDIDDLSTKRRVVPVIKKTPKSATALQGSGFLNLLSSAHPVPEPGTNNYLTFLSSVAFYPWDSNVINLIRVKSLKRRKIIAQWPVERLPYMHSFSVTQTKAILLASPFHVNIYCMAQKAEPFSCLDWDGTQPATLYVVGLGSGHIQTVTMPCVFTMHHVNAYDVNETTIIMDISTYPNPDFVHHLELEILRDPVKRNSFAAHALLKRLSIDLVKGQVTELPIDIDPSNPSLASLLDMPVINEKYRSKHYCFVYGLVIKTDNITLSATAVVKKDLCGRGKADLTWQMAGHFPVEPWFVPTPGATAEDDGLLLVPVLDGVREITYLSVLDARTMTSVNRADLPTYIPYSLHGRYFEQEDK